MVVVFSLVQLNISSDGRLFASASDNGTITLWDANGILQQTLNSHHEPANCVTLSLNGKQLMSASDDDEMLWLLEY